MIAAIELPVFCIILKQIDNEGPGFLSSLKLVHEIVLSYQLDVATFVNMGPSKRMPWKPRSLPQQRRLLEPFATLHSVTDLKIGDVGGKTNYIDAQLMRDVKERASRPAYSTEEVLDTSAKIKEPWNEAFRTGEFMLASSRYKSALENIEA